MKLTIYLLRQTVTDLGQCLPDRHKVNAGYKEIQPTSALPFPCRAWVQQNRPKSPRWLDWLSNAFDFSKVDLVNTSNSVVLALGASDRYFAVTFGYGYGVIDRSLVETDFGLRVTLNAVDPDRLDTLNTRTLDRVTKQTRTHLSIGRSVQEFGIDADVDWLRSVRGKTDGAGIAGTVEGADSVRINWNGALDELGDCCARLLALYGSENYKTRFGFVDHVRPLRNTDAVTHSLDQRVVDLLHQRDDSSLSIAHPEPPSSDVEAFKISCGHVKRDDIEELDLATVLDFLDEYRERRGEAPDVQKVWVLALDGSGQPRSQRTSIWNYLVAQLEHDGDTYVLSLGQWFRIESEYLQRLRAKVAEIPDITEELGLPVWKDGVAEAKYNEDLAMERGWLLLDRKMFTIGGPTNKVECADMLTKDRDFIHVKRMRASATLSHLFAQGTVSAELYRAEPDYRQEVMNKYHERYGTAFEGSADLRVVFAISTERKGTLADNLFFFSLVNLAHHQQRLNAMRCTMALCKIVRNATVDDDAAG